MSAWRARARLRIGVTAAIQAELPGTGDGNMWHHVLAELRDRADVKLVRRGRATYGWRDYEAVRHATVRLATGGRPHLLAIVGRPAPDRSAERYAAEATAELPGHPGRAVRLESVSVERAAALMAGAAVFCSSTTRSASNHSRPFGSYTTLPRKRPPRNATRPTTRSQTGHSR